MRNACGGLAMRDAIVSRAAEDSVLKGIEVRIVKAFLDEVVLKELRNKPLGGYDVISLVYKKFGILLSSGTVYSQIYALERKGLIKANLNPRRRDYTLTEKGKETMEAILNAQYKIKTLLNTIF
jgi:DNA-binding PadR family transcriptional regulator